MGEENGEGKSLAETPTYAVATVITVLVSLSFLFQSSLRKLMKWLDRTKRKSLLSALEKIKEELMLFGLLSLLMAHWTIVLAKICVKSSVISSKFFPCAIERNSAKRVVWWREHSNKTVPKELARIGLHNYCPEGHESLASVESLEQLHRFVFALGVTHVTYSFIAVGLAIIKIYSWRTWENEAKTISIQSIQGTSQSTSSTQLRRLNTFIFHRTSHPWSRHRIFVWLNHEVPMKYNFHNYMLRSMVEEFSDIVGVSVILWVYAICCIFLNFHGSNIYSWLSFVPAILIVIIGTKLHQVVVKLAVETIDRCPNMKPHQFNLRDELFWFGKPRFLLRLIQVISFLNAFEMATFLWSQWEIKNPYCFMENVTVIVIRLSFGVISQIWCSFITFPLYVIITQMGSRLKKTVISENVRISLSNWQRRAKERQGSFDGLLNATSTSPLPLDSLIFGTDKFNSRALNIEEGSSSGTKDICLSYLDHESKMQENAPFPSYEDDHDHDHNRYLNDESYSPPMLSAKASF